MNGEERIRIYLNRAFSGTLQTDAVSEAKESLFADLREKYTSLVSQGQSEEAAYQSVISGIGDIFELVDSISEDCGQTAVFTEPRIISAVPKLRNHLPFIAAGIFFLFFLIRQLLLPDIRIRLMIPALVIGIAFGCVLMIAIWHPEKIFHKSQATKSRIAIISIWTVACLLFICAMFLPRLEPVLWLIPLGALAIHQLISISIIYYKNSDSKEVRP